MLIQGGRGKSAHLIGESTKATDIWLTLFGLERLLVQSVSRSSRGRFSRSHIGHYFDGTNRCMSGVWFLI